MPLPFPCPVCRHEFRTEDLLVEHYNGVHNDEDMRSATYSMSSTASTPTKHKRLKAGSIQSARSVQSIPSGLSRVFPAIEGWLTKRGARNKRSWKTRWFEAYPGPNGVIHYYKDKESVKPLGSIDLHNADVRPSLRASDVAVFVVVTPKRVWELAANSQSVLERWLGALGYAKISRADELIMEAEEMLLSLSDPEQGTLPPVKEEEEGHSTGGDEVAPKLQMRKSFRAPSTTEERNGVFAKRLSKMELPDFSRTEDFSETDSHTMNPTSGGEDEDDTDEEFEEDRAREGSVRRTSTEESILLDGELATSPQWPPRKAAALLGLLDQPGIDL
eukprot:m.91891 g.91891  ORF g.91891 m.91891 type:complete len:331 (+) comp13320_c0_seq8:338-1330(+)